MLAEELVEEDVTAEGTVAATAIKAATIDE